MKERKAVVLCWVWCKLAGEGQGRPRRVGRIFLRTSGRKLLRMAAPGQREQWCSPGWGWGEECSRGRERGKPQGARATERLGPTEFPGAG